MQWLRTLPPTVFIMKNFKTFLQQLQATSNHLYSKCKNAPTKCINEYFILYIVEPICSMFFSGISKLLTCWPNIAHCVFCCSQWHEIALFLSHSELMPVLQVFLAGKCRPVKVNVSKSLANSYVHTAFVVASLFMRHAWSSQKMRRFVCSLRFQSHRPGTH